MSKCILILSNKCSGSSACQNLLARHSKVNVVKHTRHFENETLYWTKAASILRMPQVQMVDSEVPIGYERAKRELTSFLTDNLGAYDQPADERELIFDGWRRLCEKHAPIFLEKSPHHLCQWSALELILESINKLRDIDFMMIGLVRNPMDVLYSSFRQWKSLPEQIQYEWQTAYRNLRKLAGIASDRLVVVRYEDMVTSLEYLRPVFDFCGVPMDQVDNNYLHRKSISRWKSKKLYGFKLADSVRELAESYGYTSDDLRNESNPLWPAYRQATRTLFKVALPVRRLLGK